MKRLIPALLLVTLVLSGCTPLERTAYQTVVAAKGFLDSVKSSHPECVTGAGENTQTCIVLSKAVGAKDSLINALEVYCSGPQFESGGACQPPAQGTPAATQAADKLKAAIANYNQIAADLKKAIGS